MKKYLLYALMGFSTFSFTACEDDEMTPLEGTDREFMTMFICDNNRGKGEDYPFNSTNTGVNGNDIHLYWYGVNDCAGFHIRQAIQPNVSGGSAAWEQTATEGKLLLDTIVGPDVLDLVIKDQQYSTDFRFSIRTLSKLDKNILGDESTFEHASKWYGHGDGRGWSEYLNIQTAARYATPFCVSVDASQTTKNTLKVKLARNFDEIVKNGVSADDQEMYKEKFHIDADGNFEYQWLEVAPSPNNPESTVGDKWRSYKIQQEDFDNGYVVVDGLTENSVYVINVRNEKIDVKWDAYYNTYAARTDGEPGDPILIKHEIFTGTPEREEGMDDAGYQTLCKNYEAAKEWNAVRLDKILTDFISDITLAEGTIFELEGGKNYVMFNNVTTCKGFVLRTNPEDIAAGKGNAKVFLGGTRMEGLATNSNNLMFGRSPEPGEGGEIYMKMLEFHNIDWDCPMAINYGDNQAGAGNVTGNYFINMYSNGMAVHLEKFVIKDCTFKRMVRGFIREQGSNYKIWDQVIMDGNQFFDCGYYNNGAGGYPWIAGSGKNANSNLYRDFQVTNNTFYDCPFNNFFNETKELSWTDSQPWRLTFSNNTVVNFNTRKAGHMFAIRGIPNNSVITVEKNLLVMTKQAGDERSMVFSGGDVRNTMKDPVSGERGHVTLKFNDNYSTNTNLTKFGDTESIFNSNPWTATKNNFGTLVDKKYATLEGSLEVIVDNISPEELFVSPNPPHKAGSNNDQHMHRADALDGTAGEYNVDLHIKSSASGSQIYQKRIGAARWYEAQ